jgi:hypothetical protein
MRPSGLLTTLAAESSSSTTGGSDKVNDEFSPYEVSLLYFNGLFKMP